MGLNWFSLRFENDSQTWLFAMNCELKKVKEVLKGMGVNPHITLSLGRLSSTQVEQYINKGYKRLINK